MATMNTKEVKNAIKRSNVVDSRTRICAWKGNTIIIKNHKMYTLVDRKNSLYCHC